MIITLLILTVVWIVYLDTTDTTEAQTVQVISALFYGFYLCHKRPLIQYVPNGNQNPTRVSTPQGYALVFKYVRGDGTPSQFGKLDVLM